VHLVVVGAGNQGLGLAAQLVPEPDVAAVTVLDYDADRAARGVERLRTRVKAGASTLLRSAAVDASDAGAVAALVGDAAVVLNATMPELNLPVMRACLEARAHYVDLYAHAASTPDVDPDTTLTAQLALSDEFAAARLLAVPSVGVNPGWVDVTICAEVARFEQVEHVVVREIEWMDSDELLCSGPPAILLELFFADPGPVRVESGEIVVLDLVRDEEVYEFPEPIGRQAVLPVNSTAANAVVEAATGAPVARVEEKLAVLSAGLSMKEILLTAVAAQLKDHSSGEDLLALFGSSLTPTSDIDFDGARRSGSVRDAAWASVVEVRGRVNGAEVERTIACFATMDATSMRIPWAPPGVLATTAMPVEVALRAARGELGVVGVQMASAVAEIRRCSDAIEARGLQIVSSERAIAR
jgi:hypothetical protein